MNAIPKSPIPLIAAWILACAPAYPAAQPQIESADPHLAMQVINSLGIDLLRTATDPDRNALLSPYSVQTSLAMAYAGSHGRTRDEMAEVLHYPKDEAALHQSLAGLQASLDKITENTRQRVANAKRFGGPTDPVELQSANRLFGQNGYAFKSPFLNLLNNTYKAPLEIVDYIRNAPGARAQINDWVSRQTRDKIPNLIPENALDRFSRLVLVNALYLKAPWNDEFLRNSTKPRPFHFANGTSAEVPTMVNRSRYGYGNLKTFEVLTLPYLGGDLQLLIFLPQAPSDLGKVEDRFSPTFLAESGQAAPRDVVLYFPKFKLEPPALELSGALQDLGMKTAFDIPEGSADFDRMAPRRPPSDYLKISEVFHKTFLDLDESGTEAAAATAVLMAAPTSAVGGPKPKPIEVHVDHPFLFAIQHRSSGTCLFLGRVTDPRP